MGKSLVLAVLLVVIVTLGDCSPRLKKLPSITYDALREYEKRHGGGMTTRVRDSDLEGGGDSETAETGPIATSVAAYTAFNAIRSMRNLLRSSVATPTSSSSISTREVPSSFSHQYSNAPKYKSSSGLSKETPLRPYEPQEVFSNTNDYEVYQSAPGGPQGRINYVLMPFRVMRNVASGAMHMGKNFASTFSSEFKNHYNTLANDLTERILPEAANYWGVWTQPPHVEKGGYNNWMDGV